MERNQFDRLTRTLATEASRRRFGGLLLALGLGSSAGLGLLGAAETAAKRKKHKKKHKNKGKPKVRPDAGCAGPTTTFAGYGDDARFAQTFSPLRSGKLTAARFPVSKDVGSTGDYVLHLAAVDGAFVGFPTNTVLATATLPNSAVPDGQSAPKFFFETPPTVAAGTIYALILARPGGSQMEALLTSDSGCHGGGAAFFSVTQSGAFSPIAGSFDFDHAPFQTFVAS
jgi:hypothetical protein